RGRRSVAQRGARDVRSGGAAREGVRGYGLRARLSGEARRRARSAAEGGGPAHAGRVLDGFVVPLIKNDGTLLAAWLPVPPRLRRRRQRASRRSAADRLDFARFAGRFVTECSNFRWF